MSHGFSVASLKTVEGIFDMHINNLLLKLEQHALSGQVLDLKQALSFYGYDITGHLAFSTQYNTQVLNDPDELPPLNDHFLLGNMYGSVANLLPQIRTMTSWHPWVKRLHNSRAALAQNASDRVADAIRNHKSDEKIRTLLTSLIDARDPETGAKLDVAEINSEAFGFLVAGSHTTGSSLVILFYYLLHNPETLHRLVQELDVQLPSAQTPVSSIYEFAGLETKLPYALACIRGSFRMTPIAAMFLPREILNPEGLEISGSHIPQGTNCSMVNLCLHHNPSVWGPNHNIFDPSRFLPESPPSNPSHANLLLHFGQGPRQCIGRNIAMMSIWKILVALLKNYEFEPVDRDEKPEMLNVGVGEKKGQMEVRVRRRIA